MEGEDSISSNTDDLGEPDVKAILLGDSAVGKSKLVERFLDDEFNPRRVSFLIPVPRKYMHICSNLTIVIQALHARSYNISQEHEAR